MENSVLLLWDFWSILGRIVALIAIIVFALGVENIVIKLVADIQHWRHRQSDPSVEMLRRKGERLTAILVPITWAAPLANAMINRIERTLDYRNYMVFVGVRASDTKTIAALRRKGRGESRIRLHVFEDGQDISLGSALNALLDEVRRFERKSDHEFRTYLVHGPEAVLHPLSLKLANWHGEFSSIVQLPVFSLRRNAWSLTGGAAMDDLGEHHAKEQLLRSRVVQDVPVHDVGLALRRDAVWALKLRGDVFDEASDTPIRDAVERLNARGYTSAFVWQHDQHRKVIALEQLAPPTYGDAVRHKALRLSNPSLSDGGELTSPQGSLWAHYFNFRKRRTVFVACTIGAAVLTGLSLITALIVGKSVLGVDAMPPLVEAPWVIAILLANAAFVGAALIERTVLTARARGPLQALLLPLSLVSSAVVTAHAVMLASRRGGSGDQRVSPIHPMHMAAKGLAILTHTPKVTDVLVDAGEMTLEDAKAALTYSRTTGRRLELALQDLRLVDPITTAKALSAKLDLEFGRIDGPLDTYTSVFLGRHEAERFSAFAQVAEDGGIDVYVGEDHLMRDWRALRAALRTAGIQRPNFKIAPLGEIAYAIRFAGTAQEMAVEQALAVYLMDGPIPEGSARTIRRKLRGPYRRLEDLLVERGLIQPRRMRLVRRRIGREGLGIEDVVSRDRRIPPYTLAETIREFNEWKPAIAPLTSLAPMARFDRNKSAAQGPRLAA